VNGGRQMDLTDTSGYDKRDARQYTPTPGGSIYVAASRMEWTPWRIPGSMVKVLYEDRQTGEFTALIKFPGGTRIAAHEHPALEQTLVLQGQMEDHDGVAHSGDFIVRKPHSRHENYCPVDTIVLAVYRKHNILYEQDGAAA